MPQTNASNFTLQSANHTFSVIWKLTRMMKKAGWTTVAHSDGTTKQASGTNNNDSWGSNADPANDTYPAFDSAAAWIVMRGPSTVKVTITSAPTGTPLRGEIVIQASSGATGELLGYVYDTGTTSGWAVIQPRTGTFNGTNNITGNTSGAVFTITGQKLFYREFMFSKNSANTTSGTIYYICADSSAESAQLFSTLATNANAITPPGTGVLGGNGFPSKGICCKGSPGSISHVVFFNGATGFNNKAQIMCANATADSSNSADGSFWAIVANTTSTDCQNYNGFCRLDDSEPGDIDPYICIFPSAVSTPTYANGTSAMNAGNSNALPYSEMSSSTTVTIIGNMSRDNTAVTARDKCVYFSLFHPYNGNSGSFLIIPSTGINYTLTNTPSSSPPFIRIHPYAIYLKSSTSEIFCKGRLRWLIFSASGARIDTLDNKRWIAIDARSGSSSPCVSIGPYDGTTTPSSS